MVLSTLGMTSGRQDSVKNVAFQKAIYLTLLLFSEFLNNTIFPQMERPSFFEDFSQSDRSLTVSLFTAVIVCIAVVIHIVPMPTRAGVDRSLESFVLESMAIAMNTPEEIELEEVTEDVVLEEEPEVTLEDFDELLSSFMDLSLSDVPSLNEEGLETKTSQSLLQTEPELDFGTEDALGGLGTGRTDRNPDLFPQVERSPGTLLRPNIVSGLSSSPDIQLTDGTGDVSEGELTLREEDSARLGTLESVYEGLDRSTLTPDEVAREDAVVLWMKASQGMSLDPAIRALFRSAAADLVFKGPVLLDGQNWTLQLAYAPSSRTLKIALIQGSILFYFIDPGLQNRANYHEKGRVEFDEDSRVVSLELEETSVQSPDAIRVFNLFLSWWSNESQSNG